MDQKKSFQPFGKNTNYIFGLSIIIIAVILAIVVHDMSEAGIFDLPGDAETSSN